MSDPRTTLPTGAVVDCYSIIRHMSTGGFSFIYLAQDQDDFEEVVIKEFFPKKLVARDPFNRVSVVNRHWTDAYNQGRKLFFQEARVLAKLRHPNIVYVRNCVLANGTAYLVMDYVQGKNLASYVKARGGGLSTTFLMTVFPPLLDALSLIHSHALLHLDIKPSNIHLRPGGKPILLDFGAVHQFAKTRSDRKGQVVTPGFSPWEQYYATGYVGPWSDVYAVGATMRACIEGKPPPSAIERHAQDKLKPAASTFKRRYPRHLLEAVDWALEIDPELRPQTIDDFVEALMEPGERPAQADSRATGARRASADTFPPEPDSGKVSPPTEDDDPEDTGSQDQFQETK